jgi:hypothetical protein
MESETAKLLVNTLTNALGIAVDNRNKITAFEKLLESKDSDLFEKYKARLDEERKFPSTVIFPQGLAVLLSKLAQD